MNTVPFSTRLRARFARAGIQLTAFAAGGLTAWLASDDVAGLIGDDNKVVLGLAVALQPVFSQVLGQYAGRLQKWFASQERTA